LPTQIQRMCERFLAELRQDPQHHFNIANSFALYRRIGKLNFFELSSNLNSGGMPITTSGHLSRFTVADYLICWLAILTARKVLPIWNRIWGQIEFDPNTVVSVEKMLWLAEAILKNETDINYVFNIEYDEYNLGGNITLWTSYDVACAYKCAYKALLLTLHGSASSTDITGVYLPIENDKIVHTNNFIFLALHAYSSLDNQWCYLRIEYRKNGATT